MVLRLLPWHWQGKAGQHLQQDCRPDGQLRQLRKCTARMYRGACYRSAASSFCRDGFAACTFLAPPCNPPPSTCPFLQALIHASRLTRLQVGTAATQDDLEVLASLPALRHLHLASVPAAEEGAVAACVFRAMPYLRSLDLNKPMYGAEFLECCEHIA